MAEEITKSAFKVVTGRRGAKLFCNGVEIEMVEAIKVENDIRPDGLYRSCLIIDLLGETEVVCDSGEPISRENDDGT